MKKNGFTLLELIIVVTIVALVCWLGIPPVLEAHRVEKQKKGERIAGCMATIAHLQQQFKDQHMLDRDGDGVGEYGTLRDLANAFPVLGESFNKITFGRAQHDDYCLIRVYLPDAKGFGLSEIASGKPNPNVDTDQAERAWCAYAWSDNWQSTDQRIYFVNEKGVVSVINDPHFKGWSSPPPDLAFKRDVPPMSGPLDPAWEPVEK